MIKGNQVSVGGGSVGSKTYLAVIGTEWEEDSTTGVKYQLVAIDGMTADDTAQVDTVMTHDRTSDGYALYVEEQNQFLTYITNGDAETVEGGIMFYLYGEEVPTIEIPIKVVVI